MNISTTGKKAALIDSNNIVQNIIVWQDGDIIPQELTPVVLDLDEPVSHGFIYNGDKTFTNPFPEPEPNVAPQPSINELKAKLETLTAQIAALSAKS